MLSALASQARAQSQTLPGSSANDSEIHRPSQPLVGRTRRSHRLSPPINEPADITLNFVNADVKDVAKTVLGDYLKLNYEIAANVQGTVTIQTSQPLTRSQVLPVLEQALRLNDMALVQTNGVYKVVPLSAASHQSGAVRAGGGTALGYGIEVVPVRYVTAAEMQKLLEPLAPASGIIHVDAARNVLIVEGTAEERQTIVDDVALFDTDSMAGMSFALLTPSYTDAEELTRDLQRVMGGFSGSLAGLVRLIPIERLNAVVAISPQPRYLEQVRAWVSRLDRPGQGSDRRIFVYHVQNGRAVDLAATLTKSLFGGSAQSYRSTSGQDVTPQQPEQSNTSSSSSSSNASPPPPPPNSESLGVGVSGLTGVTITADEVNNALVILCTPPEYTSIRTALTELDTAPLQVFLEAAIAEVTLGDKLKFGVQYALKDPHNQVVLTNSSSNTIAPSPPGLSYLYTNGSSIQVILNTISSETHVEVISSPKLLVLNNQPAILQVGDRVPVVTQQAVSTITTGAPVVNSVQYQDTGVILKVTPRVNSGGLVLLDISQEVSSVTNTTTSGIDSPTIQERKINSAVAVQDGETVALGGLIQDSKDKSKSGVPYLQDIPLLGNLFATTNNNATRTELMVLITPRVVDSLAKARAITNELRKKLPSVQQVFERGR